MKHRKLFLVLPLLMAGLALHAETINLAELTGDENGLYTLHNGDFVYGTLVNSVGLRIAPDATITLSNVHINEDRSLALSSFVRPAIYCEGNAVIQLNGSSVIRGLDMSCPAICVSNFYTLEISGAGSKLDVFGNQAAAIGGGQYHSCGNIYIHGCTVNATGEGGAAGIGSGPDGHGCGNITFMGAVITAEGGLSGGAAIGSGLNSSCGDILIKSGKVTAIAGGFAAGIGSGNKGDCKSIKIIDGDITAEGSHYSAAIGMGYEGACGPISIAPIYHLHLTATAGNGGLCSIGYATNGAADMRGDITILDVVHPEGINESPYVLDWERPEAIEDIQGNNLLQGTKLIHNGQLLIRHGEDCYNLQGQSVK